MQALRYSISRSGYLKFVDALDLVSDTGIEEGQVNIYTHTYRLPQPCEQLHSLSIVVSFVKQLMHMREIFK